MTDYNYTTQPYGISTNGVTFPASTARPATPTEAYLPLTIVLIILYSFIFISVYLQLILILYYKHKRFSYQVVLLFLSLFWSALRIILFSFYFNNAKDANRLQFILYFFLYCFPDFLQFCTLCLLVSYYGSVYYKIVARNTATIKQKRLILKFGILTCVGIFFTVNLSSALYNREYCTFGYTNCSIFETTIVRVLVTDILFVVFGFILGYFLFKLARINRFYSIPEYQNISIQKAILVTIFTSFLLISRTFYNLLAIAINSKKFNLPGFGFDWINVSDQADLVNLSETKKFVTFSLVLLVWELIPTSVIIFLFRIKRYKYSRDEIRGYQSLNTGFEKSVFIESIQRQFSESTESNQFRKMYNENVNPIYEDDEGELLLPSGNTDESD